MHKPLMLLGVILLGSLVSCDQQSNRETEVAEDSPTSSIDAPASSGAEISAEKSTETSKQDGEADMDYGDWLPMPAEIDPRFKSVYPTLVQSAMAGDASGQTNLAIVSQQLASVLARAGKDDEAYKFLTQAGRALRGGLSYATGSLPPSAIANIFFNEACAHSRSGKIKEANTALNDAVENGLTNLSAISNDEDLAGLRETSEFPKQFEVWQKKITERVKAEAQHELATGQSFPFELTGTSINGEAIDLAALKGKVTIVDIWGTWCPPCRAEIPSFIKLQETFGAQGFQMIGLNYERKKSDEENLAAVVDFVKEFGINYPCVMGSKETLAQVPDFSGYPTTLFIDKTGKVRIKAVGLHEYSYLEAIVSELLAENQ